MLKEIKSRMIILLAVALINILPAKAGAAEELLRTAVVDKVVCAADATQSYALYLPATYNRERRWPIIYCFDPGAQGKVPVNLFKAAAEKYGYILAGSNNSQNGPWEPINRAIQAVWNDTQQRFAIDNSRVYSTGHSGDAQVALTFGLFLGKPWAGAISICGSMPDLPRPDALPKDLAVFIATGIYDFNYWPSHKIGSILDGLGRTNRLETFIGGHAWPPADTILDALSWIELQAMKKGLRQRDEGWINAQFAARLERAQAIELKGNSAEAYEAFLAVAVDFRGLCDTAAAETATARLDRPDEIEKYRKELKAAEKRELERFARTNAALQGYLTTADILERHQWLDKLGIPGLLKSAEKESDRFAGQGARRLLGYLLSWAVPSAVRAYQRGDMKTAGDFYELAVLIRPESGYAWYNLACVRSRLGEIKGALAALEKAVENGMRDRATIEKDPDLEGLRKEQAYRRLVESIK
jgi:tetratricopeptide (TPR) repeat protein